MLKHKIRRLLLKHDIEHEFHHKDLLEFHIAGQYHTIEFADACEGVLQIGEGSCKELHTIHDDNFKELIDSLVE